MANTVVETKYGKLAGTIVDGVHVWKGVPYAKPPVGALRFRPPEAPEPWSGVREATSFGPISVQPPDHIIGQSFRDLHFTQSEDCLYLNIWSPSPAGDKRPVLVWIHGGAYLTGSGAIPWYDGAAFARNGNVVVVTINYRLGPLGFLDVSEVFGDEYKGSGNLGLLDQVQALRWVRENIAQFGGDPNRVTIFGESAGAGSVGTLLATPAASGLFHQAIMESGSGATGVRTPEMAADITRRFLSALGLDSSQADALRSLPAEQLVAATAQLGPGLPFGPVVDGQVLPKHPMQALADGVARHIPVLTGVNLDEANIFNVADPFWTSPDEEQARARVKMMTGASDSLIDFYLGRASGNTLFEKLMPLLSYSMFVNGMQQTADTQAQLGAPVWVYRFDWKSPAYDGRLGACHVLEIPFVFHTLDQPGAAFFTGDDPARTQLADQMHRAWIAFAWHANPQHEGIPEWPQYNTDTRPVLVFDRRTHLELDPFAAERAAWAAVQG
ncbi:MAG: carboxylesterase/lipase family protein [Alicyclobacillaceae bacterium]|nr:carboxylesterase/lipase family protein [Alicyclobacillaceae bacterium]